MFKGWSDTHYKKKEKKKGLNNNRSCYIILKFKTKYHDSWEL